MGDTTTGENLANTAGHWLWVSTRSSPTKMGLNVCTKTRAGKRQSQQATGKSVSTETRQTAEGDSKVGSVLGDWNGSSRGHST